MFTEIRDTFGTLDIFVSHARSELPTCFQEAVQEATPLMPNGGRILAITLAHRSAKAALETSVRDFAVALAARGITVNAVYPGLTADSTPKAGNVVALLCSDEASRITGQVIVADGGAALMDTVVQLEMQLAHGRIELMS
jgi:NAD(P)-dependent dehydrogenase (short-subunit alcohol dehydrogenase family)